MSYTFIFDLDATLTKTESLPVLAACVGKEEEMARRTQTAMQGAEPFVPDFVARLALLQELSISQACAVMAQLPVFEMLMQFVMAHKKNCLIVTGNLDVYLTDFLQKYQMQNRCISSRGRVECDRLVAVTHVLDKAQAVEDLPRPFVCIGDGSNDIGMIAKADIGIAFGGVHPVSDALHAVADVTVETEQELCNYLQMLVQS